jgi:hypothetical protein
MRRRDIRALRKDKRVPWTQQPRDINEKQAAMDAAWQQLDQERARAQQQEQQR